LVSPCMVTSDHFCRQALIFSFLTAGGATLACSDF
jgi:hypothetical protein